jgi:hypothetical protein
MKSVLLTFEQLETSCRAATYKRVFAPCPFFIVFISLLASLRGEFYLFKSALRPN